MKERIINITISFDMRAIPSGATITPREEVKKIVEQEMMEMFGWDEGFNDLKVNIVDRD